MIPIIAEEDYAALVEAAMSLNQYEPLNRVFGRPPLPPRPPSSPGNRPGDDFIRRADWREILEPHGWRPVAAHGDKVYWRRPGKTEGHSATTGHCSTDTRGDLLYVFTANGAPFEAEHGYSKFEAHALLNHGNDWSAAARDLQERGYGDGAGAPAGRIVLNGHSTPAPSGLLAAKRAVPEISADEVATIDDLIREGSQVEWLWPGWIPKGVLTAIAAKGGTGKTRFCADLLRRVRRGLTWPDGSPMTLPNDALALWVVSDNHHDEMVTLAECFGIKELIRINAPKDDPFSGVSLDTDEDLDALESRVKAVRPAMVIVDTVGNATDRNLSRQEEAKAFYWPLQIIARKYRCAILNLTHLNATGHFLGRRVLEKVRVAIRMEQPDEASERRRLEVVKSNSKRPPALGVTMGDDGNEYDDKPPELIGSASSGSKAASPKRSDECIEWLCGKLASGPERVTNIRTLAEEQGFSTATLYACLKPAGVEEFKQEGKKWWRVTEIRTPFD